MTFYRILAASVLAVAACLITAPVPGAAQDPDPMIMPADADEAVRDPDRFAWRVFRALNWPANVDRREADATAAFGTPGPVVWETWALASEVYLDEGRRPPAWDDLPMGLERRVDGDRYFRRYDAPRRAPVPARVAMRQSPMLPDRR